MISLTKGLYYVLIVSQQKKFYKKMLKILFQNKFLLDGNPSFLFFILILSLLKAHKILYLIFKQEIFYKELLLYRRMQNKTLPQNPNDYAMNTTTIPTKQTPTIRPTYSITYNQFEPLSEYPSLSYTQTVKTKPAITSSTSSSHAQNILDYIPKPFTKNICLTIFKENQTQDTHCLFSTITLPQDFHWLSGHMGKTRCFYKFILVDTESIVITHNKDRHFILQITNKTSFIFQRMGPTFFRKTILTKFYPFMLYPSRQQNEMVSRPVRPPLQSFLVF